MLSTRAGAIVKLALIVTVVSVAIIASKTKFTSEHTTNSRLVLSLSEALPNNNPVTVAMRRFATLVRAKTHGKVIVNVYAGGQLGQEDGEIMLTQLGVIDLTRVNAVALANVVPSVGVFTLPYIFRNTAQKYRVLDGPVGKRVRDDMTHYGLIGFDYLEAGTRSFYTSKKVIRNLGDLKGLKIRVQPSRITTRMIELLGGVPTPMNFAEVYSALQTGVVDGAENDFVTYYTSDHYEVAPYYTEDEHLSPPAVLVMNRSKFLSLPVKYQRAIRWAAHKAAMFERRTMFAAEKEAEARVRAAGVKIIRINTAPFRKAVMPLYGEFPQYSRLIREINNTK